MSDFIVLAICRWASCPGVKTGALCTTYGDDYMISKPIHHVVVVRGMPYRARDWFISRFEYYYLLCSLSGQRMSSSSILLSCVWNNQETDQSWMKGPGRNYLCRYNCSLPKKVFGLSEVLIVNVPLHLLFLVSYRWNRSQKKSERTMIIHDKRTHGVFAEILRRHPSSMWLHGRSGRGAVEYLHILYFAWQSLGPHNIIGASIQKIAYRAHP